MHVAPQQKFQAYASTSRIPFVSICYTNIPSPHILWVLQIVWAPVICLCNTHTSHTAYVGSDHSWPEPMWPALHVFCITGLEASSGSMRPIRSLVMLIVHHKQIHAQHTCTLPLNWSPLASPQLPYNITCSISFLYSAYGIPVSPPHDRPWTLRFRSKFCALGLSITAYTEPGQCQVPGKCPIYVRKRKGNLNLMYNQFWLIKNWLWSTSSGKLLSNNVWQESHMGSSVWHWAMCLTSVKATSSAPSTATCAKHHPNGTAEHQPQCQPLQKISRHTRCAQVL